MMTAGKPVLRAEGVTLSGVPEGMRTAGGWNFGEPHFTWVPKVKAFSSESLRQKDKDQLSGQAENSLFVPSGICRAYP